jgi:hypothetical protein
MSKVRYKLIWQRFGVNLELTFKKLRYKKSARHLHFTQSRSLSFDLRKFRLFEENYDSYLVIE